jgi:hypothetical protein
MEPAELQTRAFAELAEILVVCDDEGDWMRAYKYLILCCGRRCINIPLHTTNRLVHIHRFENCEYTATRMLDVVVTLCSNLGRKKEAIQESWRMLDSGLWGLSHRSMIGRLVMRVANNPEPNAGLDLMFIKHLDPPSHAP